MRGVVRAHKETLEERLKHTASLGAHGGDVAENHGLDLPVE